MSRFVAILLIISPAIQISEQIIRPDGVVSVRKGCSPIGQYEFDDGTPMTNLNQTTSTGQYYVLLCSSGDDCNSQCVTIPNPPLPPTDVLVSCYNCISYDGNDCQTNICQGKFCIYERRVTNNQLMMRKSCSDTSVIQLDDGTTIADVQYQVRVCNDGNLCNTQCAADDEPLVTCYECQAVNQMDCTTGSCQGKYCLFTRSQTSAGSYVKKSCTNIETLFYVDNVTYQSFGQCEFRQINGTNYDFKLCNSSSMCNSACPLGPVALLS
ncbi:unnamed protein product [Nippostrongylus brasiliensis]|uniref:Secreted protein n=1 Tax=Nippostrongylus brasiliensis TaxID=27835 RepID=A0A158R1P9_NIPBR|nr:unnamed protein product [Nippostrongylus brasiliensis]